MNLGPLMSVNFINEWNLMEISGIQRNEYPLIPDICSANIDMFSTLISARVLEFPLVSVNVR